MCDYGDTIPICVTIPADLSHTGREICKTAEIDRCLADLVRALQKGGIIMRGSCCGHGKSDGTILLDDGRCLVIRRGIP